MDAFVATLDDEQRNVVEKTLLMCFDNGQPVTYLGIFKHQGSYYAKYGSTNRIHERTYENRRDYKDFTLVYVQYHEENRELESKFGNHKLIQPSRKIMEILGKNHNEIISIDKEITIDYCIKVMRDLRYIQIKDFEQQTEDTKILEMKLKNAEIKLHIDAEIKKRKLKMNSEIQTKKLEIQTKKLEMDAEIRMKNAELKLNMETELRLKKLELEAEIKLKQLHAQEEIKMQKEGRKKEETKIGSIELNGNQGHFLEFFSLHARFARGKVIGVSVVKEYFDKWMGFPTGKLNSQIIREAAQQVNSQFRIEECMVCKHCLQYHIAKPKCCNRYNRVQRTRRLVVINMQLNDVLHRGTNVHV